ncbi:hypothetical protein E8E11_002693 [Didymella keratinophila]|nr:hypothetical protein E8E11_002693 [Didymella keratinophila]
MLDRLPTELKLKVLEEALSYATPVEVWYRRPFCGRKEMEGIMQLCNRELVLLALEAYYKLNIFLLRLPSEVPDFKLVSPRLPRTKDIARIRHLAIVLCAEFSCKSAFRTFKADWSSLLAHRAKNLRSNSFEGEPGDRIRWQKDFVGLECIQLKVRLRRCQCKNLDKVAKVLKYGEMRMNAKKLDVTVEFLAGASTSRLWWSGSCDCCEKVCDIVKGSLEKQM